MFEKKKPLIHNFKIDGVPCLEEVGTVTIEDCDCDKHPEKRLRQYS